MTNHRFVLLVLKTVATNTCKTSFPASVRIHDLFLKNATIVKNVTAGGVATGLTNYKSKTCKVALAVKYLFEDFVFEDFVFEDFVGCG